TSAGLIRSVSIALVLEQRGLPGSADGEFVSVNARAWPMIVDYFATDTEAITSVSVMAARAKESSLQYLTNLHFVDPAFGSIFPVDVIAGDFERVQSGPGFIALEETYKPAAQRTSCN